MEHALDLYRARATRCRDRLRCRQVVRLVRLAGAIPSLDEVLRHVGRRWAADLDIGIVPFERLGREIDAANEARFVDDPALLMMNVAVHGAVAANLQAWPRWRVDLV